MKKLFLSTFIMLFAFFGLAQKNVTGSVIDNEGKALAGATIVVQGTSNGTTTDFDGKFSIKSTEGSVLEASYLGYKTQSITIGTNANYEFVLSPDNLLEEVIITGQGSGIQKRKLSTTVDVLNEEEIDKLPALQIDQLLQSTTPSAQIRLSSGQPGTAAIIRTRGALSAATSSTPVVIVDGIRVDNLNSNPSLGADTGGVDISALADIPIESIERIEYIKGGAATTLYGADAANGVIQIITKKGKAGESNIFVETRIGAISGTDDYLKYSRTAEALFEPGLLNEYRLGMNGGTEVSTYNFSASLYKDDSFNDINEQIKRNLSFGFTRNINDKLRYQASMSYVNMDSNLDYNANTSLSRFSGFEGGGRGDLDTMEDATWDTELERSSNIGKSVDIKNRVNRFTASNKFIYKLPYNIEANFTAGLDFRTLVQQENSTNQMLIYQGSIPEGTANRASLDRLVRNNFTLTTDLNFTHRASIDNFDFVTIAGAQFFRTTDRQNLVSGSGGVDGSISVNTFPTKTSSDFVLENANYGIYFLENVGIYDVVFVEIGGRIDYNTASGESTSALFLPKVGLSYNISDHSFFKNSSISQVLSSVKLRANYGEATNYAGAFSSERTFALESFLGAPALRFSNPGNPDLKSEIVQTTEFGLELGFLNNRINLSGTYYKGITKDALFTPTQPPSSGLLNQIQNIGEIENKGYELAINANIIQKNSHNLDISVSYNKNENIVSSMGGAAPFNVGGFTVIGSWVEEGQSLGYLRGTKATSNGDGTYTFTPNSTLGNTFAPNFGSISLNYSWDKLNFFVSGDYQTGGEIVDLSFLLRHLRGVDNTGIPDDLVGTTSPFNYVNFFTFKNDFLKIRNIGVSYNFGEITNIFSNIRVGFTATNPFNWTTGLWDPETTGSGIGTQNGFSSGGFYYGTESAPRTFITSIRFEF
jgi:outer membrane receptor protein involved in Fe transport